MLEGKRHRPLLASIVAAALLSACSSSQDVLEPSAIAVPSGPTTSAVDTAQPTTAATGTTSDQVNAAASGARIHFAPIVGTSVEAATSLSNQLARRSTERGIRMTGATDKATTHLLKGYFTPLVEGKETTVIYVWDVYDPQGNRVHRISGQQKAAASGGTGWDAVPASMMQAIADATIDQMATWLAGAKG